MKARTHYRALFISDTHLGFRGARAKALLHFLESVTCEFLYLVGDIFDLWEMFKRAFWDGNCNAVLGKILSMAEAGTKVYYFPGNHDEGVRQFMPLTLGPEIEILDHGIHTTISGDRHMVVHGDIFDPVVKYAKWVAKLGSTLYDWLLVVNTYFHYARMALGCKSYWSLAGYLKAQAKSVVGFIDDFADAAIRYAKHHGCVGVVCGHIHKAALYTKDGVSYLNCGDWVESLTAGVETSAGKLELISWQETR